MIVRTWRGATRSADAATYIDYLQRTGLHEYRETPGNQGALLLRRDRGQRTEFLTVSFWRDMDAIRAFAGPDPQRAVFYPQDEAYLVEADPDVHHYELVTGTWPAEPRVDAPSAARSDRPGS